jgi:RES domain-containing protein
LSIPITLYRICKTIYADLSGFGAAMYPGRWNRKNQRAVYTAASRSEALAELLVHLPRASHPKGYSLLTLTLQPAVVVLKQTLLEAHYWFEAFNQHLSESPDDPIAFVIPSVIVAEYNVVLYPRPINFEPEFVRIESVEPFAFDERLF